MLSIFQESNKITKFFKFIVLKSIFWSLFLHRQIFLFSPCQFFSNSSPLVHFLVPFFLKFSPLVQIYLYFIASILSSQFHQHGHGHGNRHGHKTWACTQAKGTGLGTDGKVRLIFEISEAIFFFFNIQSRVQYFVFLIILLQNP